MKTILILAYQSFGVVYGDLSTSPLYVYRSTFSGRLRMDDNDDEILGVLSFIFWTLTLIPVIKYVFIVLSANDNGEGEPAQFSQVEGGSRICNQGCHVQWQPCLQLKICL